MSDKAIEDVLVEAPFPDRHHRTDRWFYSRSARAVKLRSRRVRPMVKRIRDACPWIENSDLPTLRGYCDLELIGAALMADILENGVLQEGVPRPIIDAVMRVRRTQLGYASALGLSPAARQSIRANGTSAAIDLALAAQGRDPEPEPESQPEGFSNGASNG